MIQLRYFASLAETLGCRDEQLDTHPSTISELLATLKTRGEPWQSALADERLLIAVNQTMVASDTTIADGDEVALFPPVTGG